MYPAFAQSDQTIHERIRLAKNANFLHVDNEDSDQTARMHVVAYIILIVF